MPQDGQAEIIFDEVWYLQKYPDVAQAVADGRRTSGLSHYLEHGKSEGRLPKPPSKPEPVRLLIWDLDETFWDGTLTEGGITFRQDRLDIVIELARRGIVSSICSKNDFERVKTLLVEKCAWEYFIFPSISWDAKGPRIAKLIEDVQLRAPTVMFLDDNPLNLEEAKHFVPQLQVRNHSEIGTILGDPLFKGKEDLGLTRLEQYKLLEERKRDEGAAGSADDFLRASDIKVRLEFDLLGHIDRVIELINRTNQLNFTKERLSEDPHEARAELKQILSGYSVQGALVHVVDRYGDHGFSGLYIHNSEARSLPFFCFSCRILGMGVEQWLYNKIGRPRLKIVGEVLSDPADTSRQVNWITQIDVDAHATKGEGAAPADLVVARGACDLGAVIHYFAATFPDAVGEYHQFRHGSVFRTDHSVFLRHAISGLTPEALAAAEQLGYVQGDFETRMFENSPKRIAVLLGLHSDAHFPLYRHRTSGLQVPMILGELPPNVNLCASLPNEGNHQLSDWAQRSLHLIRSQFEYKGLIGENEFKANLLLALEKIPRSTRVFLLEICTKDLLVKGALHRAPERFWSINQWIKDVSEPFSNVTRLNCSDYLKDDSEAIDHLHFNRAVFFRLYQDIVLKLNA